MIDILSATLVAMLLVRIVQIIVIYAAPAATAAHPLHYCDMQNGAYGLCRDIITWKENV